MTVKARSPLAARPARRRGRKPVADPDQIVEAALCLVDTEGLAAFNVRRLTADLQLGPMTLYGYFENKEALVDAMLAKGLEPAAAPIDPSLWWQEQLATGMRNLHAAFVEHPGLIQLLMPRSMSDPGLDRIRERLLRILLSAGFDARGSVEALRLLVSHSLGWMIQEHFRRPRDPAQEIERLRSLPPAEFPSLRKVATHYARKGSPDAYESALAALVGEVERMASRQGPR